MRQQWWVCSKMLWRCRSGQCISPRRVMNNDWDCSDLKTDFMCWNGEYAKNGWCDAKNDCFHGEDEYLCVTLLEHFVLEKIEYRPTRNPQDKYGRYSFQLPNIPFALRDSRPSPTRSIFDTAEVSTSFLAAFLCNRGVGIPMFDQSIVCFNTTARKVNFIVIE